MRVAYVRKNTNNEYSTIDLSRVGHFTVPVTANDHAAGIPEVNGANTVVTTGTVDVNLLDLDQSPFGNEQRVTNVPDGTLQVRHAAVRVQQAVRKRAVHPVEL